MDIYRIAKNNDIKRHGNWVILSSKKDHCIVQLDNIILVRKKRVKGKLGIHMTVAISKNERTECGYFLHCGIFECKKIIEQINELRNYMLLKRIEALEAEQTTPVDKEKE